MNQRIRSLIIGLWNEKDWKKKRYPDHAKAIEKYVDDSKCIKVIADLANSIKHGGLDRKSRSDVEQTDYFGRTELNDKSSRELCFLKVNGEIIELFQVLRGALDEYDVLEHRLSNEAL